MTPGNVPAGLVQESADPEQMASGPAQTSLNLQHGTVGSADPETVEPRARIVSAKARQEAAKEKEEAKELAARAVASGEAATLLLQGISADPRKAYSEASLEEQVPLLRTIHSPAGLP